MKTALTQANLDAQQSATGRALKIMRSVADAANEAADELCAGGCEQSSYDVGMIAVHAERIAADINELYRAARVLKIDLPDGGVIAPAFGDK